MVAKEPLCCLTLGTAVLRSLEVIVLLNLSVRIIRLQCGVRSHWKEQLLTADYFDFSNTANYAFIMCKNSNIFQLIVLALLIIFLENKQCVASSASSSKQIWNKYWILGLNIDSCSVIWCDWHGFSCFGKLYVSNCQNVDLFLVSHGMQIS